MVLSYKLVNLIVCLLFAAALVGQGSGYGKIYAFHIFLPLAFIALLISKKFKLSNLKSLIPLLGIFSYAALSLIWTPYFNDGMSDFAIFGLGIGLLITLMNADLNEQRLFKVMQIVVWVNIVICIGETLQLFRYPYSLFSFLAPSFGKVQSFWSPHATNIPTGLHWNPNNNAFFFLLFTPLMLRRGSYYYRTLYFLLATYIVYMSASKLVLIAWVLMSVLIPFVLDIRLKFKIAFGAVVSVMALVFILLVSFTEDRRAQDYRKTIPGIVNYLSIVPNVFIKRMFREEVAFDYTKKDLSLHERLTYLDGLAIELKEHLILGTGVGSLNRKTNTQAGVTVSIATPHFYFLELLTKYGLIIFLLYLGWLCRLAWQSFRINKLLGLSLLMFIFFSPVISSASYFLPMWALLGFSLVVIKTSQPSQAQHKQF